MGLFGKKVDYDELYRKLSPEKMTVREREKAEKLLDKLEDSGDRRGILWRPLISIQWKCADNASYFFRNGITTAELNISANAFPVRCILLQVGLISTHRIMTVLSFLRSILPAASGKSTGTTPCLAV